jgi:hypothetical protein
MLVIREGAVEAPFSSQKENAPGVFHTGRVSIAPFHYDFIGGRQVLSLPGIRCSSALR